MEHLKWHKSSYSSDVGNCVEVAGISGCTAVRDSKDPTGPVLTFTAPAWGVFTAAIAHGEFD